ncbi:MAG TPA: hypothetical protein DEG43_07825 [Acidimicrobiaceae bacterium]|nr:hypothetical protein [Acidimicrobiaceae bacterium]
MLLAVGLMLTSLNDTVWVDVVLGGAAVLAGMASLRRRLTLGHWSWTVISTGCLLFAAAETYWVLAPVFGWSESPEFNFSDLLYLPASLCFMVGMSANLLGGKELLYWRRVLVDCLLVALTIVFSAKLIILDSGIALMSTSLSQIVSLVYALVDVLVVVLALVLANTRQMVGGKRVHSREALLTALMMGLMFAADSCYVLEVHRGVFLSGPFPTVLWIGSFWVLAKMALTGSSSGTSTVAMREHFVDPSEQVRLVLVVGSVTVGAALFIATGIRSDSVSSSSLVLAGLSWMCFGIVHVLSVSEQRHLEERNRQVAAALARTEARFRTSFANGPFGMLLLTLELEILEANEAVGSLFRCDPCSLVGSDVRSLLSHNSSARLDALMEVGSVAPGGKGQLELVAKGPSGSTFPVQVWIRRFDEGGSGPILLVHVEDVSASEASQRRLEFLAHRDSLTGLWNRSSLIRSLNTPPTDLTRRGLLYLDVDHFKELNDNYGHGVGDAALQAVASRMTQTCGPGACVARLGGDEFAALVPARHAAELGDIAANVARAFESPLQLADEVLYLGVSIGTAMEGVGEIDPDRVVSEADLALYEAKRRGRNRVVAFESSMSERSAQRNDAIQDLRRGIEAGEILLHYQPIVALEGFVLSGFEALVRWDHPVRGLLAPDEFLPLAEETGLIIRIGEIVLRQACLDVASWDSAQAANGGKGLSIAVNQSPLQFVDSSVLALVAEALELSGLAPERLHLELTETALFADVDLAEMLLTELRALGVKLAVDDFGTGYSSLSHLRRFPVQHLKVDRTFVAGLVGDENDSVIVASLLGLARSLGLEVVAEGVEDHVQLARLLELGCTFGQGYLFGRPMPERLARDFALDAAAFSRSLNEVR